MILPEVRKIDKIYCKPPMAIEWCPEMATCPVTLSRNLLGEDGRISGGPLADEPHTHIGGSFTADRRPIGEQRDHRSPFEWSYCHNLIWAITVADDIEH